MTSALKKKPDSHFALVLPGAVARGAYEAGVIDILAQREMKIDRIVATSSGALNGIAYAVGIRAGREKEMAQNLVQSWIDQGSWKNSLSLNPLTWIAGRGLSDNSGLIELMRGMIKPCGGNQKRDVELRIIVTPLNGVIGKIAHKPATTYEHVISFRDEDFDTQESLEKIFKVVSAACAFPGLFKPVELEGLGACVDGGTVNNAPIAYALEESGVNRVMMPVPYPAVMAPADHRKGLSLFNHLVEVLINERLYRDLKVGQVVNREACCLEKLVEQGKITDDQLELIKRELRIQKVEITEVRPEKSLRGSPFSGFFDKSEREHLVEEGRKAALKILDQIPEHNPTGEQTT